jgi:hypothetical protein
MPTKHNMVSLSDSTKAIILGSLLGDGSLKIHSQYVNARFSFRHSIKQKEYFFWKANMLKEISGEKHFWQQPPDGLSKVDKLRYQSLALPSLSELYQLTHKGKSFEVRRKWLNEMTGLSLAIWWLDDGSIISNQRKGVICTDGFTEQEVRLISQYLKVVWHINAPVGAVSRLSANGQRRQVFRIWFRSTEELKKFLKIVAPYVEITSMLYKILILYKDPLLQQRWISEIAELTGFSEAELTAIADQRKAHLKMFQKKI